MAIENKTEKLAVNPGSYLRQFKQDGMRILLAEDNVVNQMICREVLFKLGAHTDVAASGLEVLQMLEQCQYDLILMDVQMPEMGGVEACKRIRATGNDLPIVALTANENRGSRNRFIEAGMNDHLSKPLMVDELVAVLERQLSKNSDQAKNPVLLKQRSEDYSIMDWDVLVKTLGGNITMAEDVAKEFCLQCGTLVENGFEFMNSQDWSKASSLFHRLSGSAFAIRAEELAQAAVAMEEALEKGPEDLNNLSTKSQRIKEALKRFEAKAKKHGWLPEK